MQEALAVKEQQRREEEEERKRVVEYDQGYRNYTNGALPWLERQVASVNHQYKTLSCHHTCLPDYTMYTILFILLIVHNIWKHEVPEKFLDFSFNRIPTPLHMETYYRANPFSGSEEYERYLKKEYMRGLLEDNLRLEYEKKSFQQYTTEASKEEDKDLMAQKNFWNKDSDKDKWWYKAGGGYHKGVGEYSTTIGHQIHHFAYNKWMDDEPKVPLSSYDSTAQRTWADPEQVAAATVRPATASSAYPWATHE